MAGSFQHLMNDDMTLRLDLIENLRDAGQALEECYDMIMFLTGGDKMAIYNAWFNGHQKKRVPNYDPDVSTYSEYWGKS